MAVYAPPAPPSGRVVFGRLDVVVFEARADHIGRLFRTDPGRRATALRSDRVEQAEVARRPDMVRGRLAARRDQRQRHVAGTDDGVERLGRNAELHDLRLHRRAWPRRVGDERDRAAAAAISDEGVGGGRKARLPSCNTPQTSQRMAS